MSIEVKIPSLGESITSGILSEWHVKSGDYVESGQAIYDLETDKITSEGTADESGKITLKVDEGEEVEIGSVVAIIDTEAEKPDKEEPKKKESDTEDREKEETDNRKKDSAAQEQEDPPKEESEKKQPQKKAPSSEEAEEEPAYPPSVRRIASESGIDPASVKGSGKGGRVTKEDMLDAARREKAESDGKSRGQREQDSKGESGRQSRKKMSPLRRTIANRLVQAQQSTAMLTTFNEVDMSSVMRLRKTHQEAFGNKHGVKLGFMSFFTKAVVHALKEVPSVNAQVDGDEIVTNHYYDIGVAVSTPKGLMVPVLRDCDQASFAEIEKSLIDYSNKAKDGKIGIDDLQGGVFTISNGGIFGSMLSTPILNSPQSAILGMHTIKERPVAIEGEVVIRPMMYLALSYDHRIVDGREAVGFLVAVKNVIEDPARLLFEI